ncbi:ABC transporter ATP-binding protein [Desulfosarcina sp. OttesenSCG-928-A07]|nr:ABC transporter ATP-binding protein [Desulfosarcina sp. OttesenSCG-928-G17]MDL2329625.1 ABC transporter ATP-binding protein [Desulfosarcina sp. OttesenSCG-928-A07]
MTTCQNTLAIDVQNLGKSFGSKKVVDNVSLTVERGEIYGFLGPNGSGKTTCIRLMCGLLTPDSGSGTCLGFNILRESTHIKRRIGYMTQKFSFWDDLTIRENLDFVARLFAIKGRKAAVDQTLEKLRLQDRANQLTGTLSGGWKQRLALAACMLHKPKLLLLDEPTSGVDPTARRDFWDELHSLAARGISVLVSTHYMDEAERCHKLAYIAYGKLMATGTAPEIIAAKGLHTVVVHGEHLQALSEKLDHTPEVEQTVMFGTSLHASGLDKDALLSTVTDIAGTGLYVEPVETSLEDVFVYMMHRSQNNLRLPQ